MVDSPYGEIVSPRNAALRDFAPPACLACPEPLASAPGSQATVPPHATSRHLTNSPLLSSSVRETLLAGLAETGSAELGALVSLLPDHPRPLGAVIALVDDGVLGMDLSSPFDASCRVWRCDPVRA